MSVTFSGGITFTGGGFSFTEAPPPSEATAGWYGGGSGPLSTSQRITYATDTATASLRGPLSLARSYLAAAGNLSYGWFGGGLTYPGAVLHSIVDRITYADDTATASVRGPLSITIINFTAAGNTTDGWFGGGSATPGRVSTVQRITYSTDTATASVRGPLSLARASLAATGNTTDGWFGGGYTSGNAVTVVDRITYATDTATASVRGSLSAVYYLASTGNLTDGWFAGGKGAFPAFVTLSTVQRITYATDTVTASVRGPLSSARYILAASGNTTDGWFGGGFPVSTVDRITYATDTNAASVRGPLSVAAWFLAAAAGIQ